MPAMNVPQFFLDRRMSQEEAMTQLVKSGSIVASGFATSEPLAFYMRLWDFIREHDIHDLNIRQALAMGAHPLYLGDALQAQGALDSMVDGTKSLPALSGLIKKANQATKKLDGLRRLIAHYEELKARRITFTSPFIGAALNPIIPPNALTRLKYPDYVGRNTTRMGICDMQSIHFPDAVDTLGYDPDGKPRIDTFVCVMTPPNEEGELSHAAANGANGEIVDKILAQGGVNLLLYLNPNYPFTRGYSDAPNTVHVSQFERLAKEGRLFVVEDTTKIPALPKGYLGNPSEYELKIAEHVVNHIEMNLRFTAGRAIQVGIGMTGVQAIKRLKESSWNGRSYTEMLEPFTLDLFEAGKIAGSHFVESDGRRTQLDGKMCCTFTICEEGGDFYKKIDKHPDLIVAAASRIVVPEAFHYGLGINNALAIDFHGHVNSCGRYKNHHSGIGGLASIWRGLLRGGVGYLCCKSTYTDFDGNLQSAIRPFLPEGSTVGLIGPDLMGGRDGARFFLATEHGVVQLNGKSQSEFIRALISVAHPDFRPWLAQEAYKEFRVR